MTDLHADAADVVRLAERHGLVVDPASLRFNEMGLDFRVVLATAADGTGWVLRIPRRPDVAERARGEARILALVARHLPVAVPEWRIATDALIAYPMLPGAPALTFDATHAVTWHLDRDAPAYARTLGAAMAALHAIPPDEARAAGLPVLTPAEVRERWRTDLDRVREHFAVSASRWEAWQAWLADDGCWPDFTVPIHGDLYAGHVMVAPDGRVTGILDWTEARVGDPAVDLSGHLKVFGEAGLAELLGHYRAAGGRTWPGLEAQCRRLLDAGAASYALYALTTGRPEHRAAAQAALDGAAG